MSGVLTRTTGGAYDPKIIGKTMTKLRYLRRILSTLALSLALGPASALGAPATGPQATPAPHLPAAFEDLDDVPIPDPDLWHRIRVGFMMEALDSPLVLEHEAW